MWSILLLCWLSIHIIDVLSHPPLDFDIVNKRTCPYSNDMEQRMANLAEYIYKVSNNIPYAMDKAKFDDRLKTYIFDNDMQVIVFPHTITESQSYFTVGAFKAGLTDLSKHSSWFSMDAIINGVNTQTDMNMEEKSSEEEEGGFGQTSTVSFYDFLSDLDFGVKIVDGCAYYFCDESHSWGFNQATVFIKEKIKNENKGKICTPKTYIGTAEIYPTFTRDIDTEKGIDEWKMGEFSVFWDIYSTTDAIECMNIETETVIDNGNSNSNVNFVSFNWFGYKEIIGILGGVIVLCAIIVCWSCSKYVKYKRINGFEEFDHQYMSINTN